MGISQDHSNLTSFLLAGFLALGFLPGMVFHGVAAGGVSLEGSLGPKGPLGPATLLGKSRRQGERESGHLLGSAKPGDLKGSARECFSGKEQ